MNIKPGTQPDTEVNGKAVYLSRHAIEAVIARSFTIDDVYATLRDWENKYVQTKYSTGEDTAFMYQKGDMGVAVVETESVILVKTVLLRRSRQWTDEQARERPRAGDHARA